MVLPKANLNESLRALNIPIQIVRSEKEVSRVKPKDLCTTKLYSLAYSRSSEAKWNSEIFIDVAERESQWIFESPCNGVQLQLLTGTEFVSSLLLMFTCLYTIPVHFLANPTKRFDQRFTSVLLHCLLLGVVYLYVGYYLPHWNKTIRVPVTISPRSHP